jgi:hypothetical protein
MLENNDPYRGEYYAYEINGIRMDVYRIADLYGLMQICGMRCRMIEQVEYYHERI